MSDTADATAYRALVELLNRAIEVTIYGEGDDVPPRSVALMVVSPECARTFKDAAK